MDGCIHHLIEQQVEQTPAATAIIFNEQRVTYDQLNRRANQLAHFMRSKGVKRETLVGICLNRSVEMLEAQLAALKAGAAYVPFDLSYPRERLRFMLADANPAFLITSEHRTAEIPFSPTALIDLEADRRSIAQCSDENSHLTLSPDGLAYVLYTSGSTGSPKGAMVPHRGVVNYLQHMASAHGLGPADPGKGGWRRRRGERGVSGCRFQVSSQKRNPITQESSGRMPPLY